MSLTVPPWLRAKDQALSLFFSKVVTDAKEDDQTLQLRNVLSGLGLSKQDSCLGRTRGGGISAATGVGSLTSGGCGAWVDLAKGPGVGEGGVVGEDGGGWGCGAST
ncbi:hypothetical protein F5877DRAFT_72450 [Lentinula edodes]|nr:hypothetical protein F5877DRAFT_72450 [Lentinula edodes]